MCDTAESNHGHVIYILIFYWIAVQWMLHCMHSANNTNVHRTSHMVDYNWYFDCIRVFNPLDFDKGVRSEFRAGK